RRLALLGISVAVALGLASTAAAVPRILAEVHVTALLDSTGVKFLTFRVTQVPAGATVSLQCASGCSVSETITAQSGGTVSSTALKGTRLPTGAVLIVRVTKPDFIGFYDRLVILDSTRLRAAN